MCRPEAAALLPSSEPFAGRPSRRPSDREGRAALHACNAARAAPSPERTRILGNADESIAEHIKPGPHECKLQTNLHEARSVQPHPWHCNVVSFDVSLRRSLQL